MKIIYKYDDTMMWLSRMLYIAAAGELFIHGKRILPERGFYRSVCLGENGLAVCPKE
ncbi:MAG: hypothetical protein HFH91_12785 [Lachnospiraceae bacterium]|nr:hypothetical protein [Lachnospiraceae bacterium]